MLTHTFIKIYCVSILTHVRRVKGYNHVKEKRKKSFEGFHRGILGKLRGLNKV